MGMNDHLKKEFLLEANENGVSPKKTRALYKILSKYIDKATLAERRRCAEVARTHEEEWFLTAERNAGEAISKAIEEDV